MTPILEVLKRIQAPNVSLWSDEQGIPVRIKISTPLARQYSLAKTLAEEFALDCEYWENEDELIIQPEDYDGCVFHEIQAP